MHVDNVRLTGNYEGTVAAAKYNLVTPTEYEHAKAHLQELTAQKAAVQASFEAVCVKRPDVVSGLKAIASDLATYQRTSEFGWLVENELHVKLAPSEPSPLAGFSMKVSNLPDDDVDAIPVLRGEARGGSRSTSAQASHHAWVAGEVGVHGDVRVAGFFEKLAHLFALSGTDFESEQAGRCEERYGARDQALDRVEAVRSSEQGQGGLVIAHVQARVIERSSVPMYGRLATMTSNVPLMAVSRSDSKSSTVACNVAALARAVQ